jgi:CRP-like cAMP-binding protein
MYADFENYIREHTTLCDEELQLIRSKAVEKKLRKKEFLLREGEVCRQKIFVCKGILRTYRTREDGTEYIILLSPENWWATDPENRDNKTPSRYNIDAVEDCDVIVWNKKDFEELYAQIPGLNSYTEKLIGRSVDLGRQRLFSALSATPEEKYDEFMETYPGLLARLPLQMVASYIGVSLKTLSRIRLAQVKR